MAFPCGQDRVLAFACVFVSAIHAGAAPAAVPTAPAPPTAVAPFGMKCVSDEVQNNRIPALGGIGDPRAIPVSTCASACFQSKYCQFFVHESKSGKCTR